MIEANGERDIMRFLIIVIAAISVGLLEARSCATTTKPPCTASKKIHDEQTTLVAEKTPTQHRTHATTTEGPPFGDVTTKKHKIFTTQKLKTTTIVGSPATELSKTQNKTTEKDRTKKINFSTTRGLPLEESTQPLDVEETPSSSGYGRKTTRQTTREISSTLYYGEEETSKHSSTQITHKNKLDFFTKEPYPTEKPETHTKGELETSTTSQIEISTPVEEYGKRTTKKTTDDISSTSQYEDSTTKEQTVEYNRKTTFKSGSSSHKPHQSTTTQTEPSTTENVDESEYSTPQYGSLETSTNQQPSTTRGNNIKTTTSKNRFESTTVQKTYKPSYTTASTTLEDLEITNPLSTPNNINDQKTTKESYEDISSTPQYGEEKPSTRSSTRTTHENNLDFSTKEHEGSTTYELETSTIYHKKISTPAQGYGRRTTEQASDNISSTLQNEDSKTEKQTADYNRRTTSHEPHHSTTTQTEPSTTEEVDESEYSTPQYGSLETSTKPPRFGSTSKKQTHKYSSSILEALENTQSSSEPTHDYGKKTTEKETLPPFDEETTTSESSSRHSSPTSFSQTSTYGLPYEGSTLPLDDEETPSNSGYGRRTTRQTTQGFSSASQFDKEKTSAHSSTGSITDHSQKTSTSFSNTVSTTPSFTEIYSTPSIPQNTKRTSKKFFSPQTSTVSFSKQFSKSVACSGERFVLDSEVTSPESLVDVKLVDNFNKFMNITPERFLKWQKNIPNIYSLFKKDRLWYIHENSHLWYEVLLRVSIKPSVCPLPSISKISLQVDNQDELKLRIDRKWLHYKNPNPNGSFTVDLDQTWNADHFDIFLHSNPSGKPGKAGNVRIEACCGTSRPDVY